MAASPVDTQLRDILDSGGTVRETLEDLVRLVEGGTAAFHDKTVTASDIENDPLWADYKGWRCATDRAPAGPRRSKP